ncbi:MAG: ABC transporter ATP-binding protein, partial [Deltaproteobacteria bacterium]|nr:ABC transporter ATP-binding protein [Deltaproteobacteria bacterium]
ILIDGEVVNDWTPAERNVAMAFETYALYSHLSVGENLGLCLKAKGVPEDDIQEQVNQMAAVLQISDILNAKSSGLSGGQQQRVSLGRALIRQPSVTLLDEPLSHLDSALRLETRIEIKRIHQQLKKTFIFVTHDQMEALALSDRVAVMNFAELQQVGTRQDLFETPANLFVAGFVGEPPINFYPDSTIQDINGDRYAVTEKGEFRFKLSQEMKAVLDARHRKTVTVGVRPQSLSLSAGAGKESLSANVSVFEFLGEIGNLTVSRNDMDLNVLAPPDFDTLEGKTLKTYYDPKRILLFDSDTEDNLFFEIVK